jgi:hypothetical protein
VEQLSGVFEGPAEAARLAAGGPVVWRNERESEEEKAEGIVRRGLERLGWSEGELESRPKGDRRKVALALEVRSRTTMSLKWVAGRLRMGTWTNLSNLLSPGAALEKFFLSFGPARRQFGPMLTSAPTKYGAGITVYGDFLDLDTLHHIIHKIAHEGFVDERAGNFILGLAYDIRKAKEKKREVKKLGIPSQETANYKGVSVLWTEFLVQVALLRQYAAYRDTDHRDQAFLYLLEDCAITSLLAFNPGTGKECVELLLRFPSFPNDYLFEYCNDCSRRYVAIPGPRRFQALPVMLRSMWWMSPEYERFEERLSGEAKKRGCSPQELSDPRDFPRFRW